MGFRDDIVLRDIRKAYLCFMGCSVVSTGHWGCGIFGGLPAFKFVQQALAASLAGCKLQYSTFGSPDGCDQILQDLEELKPTPAQLLLALRAASAACLGKPAEKLKFF